MIIFQFLTTFIFLIKNKTTWNSTQVDFVKNSLKIKNLKMKWLKKISIAKNEMKKNKNHEVFIFHLKFVTINIKGWKNILITYLV
jgi:hypothetical protein